MPSTHQKQELQKSHSTHGKDLLADLPIPRKVKREALDRSPELAWTSLPFCVEHSQHYFGLLSMNHHNREHFGKKSDEENSRCNVCKKPLTALDILFVGVLSLWPVVYCVAVSVSKKRKDVIAHLNDRALSRLSDIAQSIADRAKAAQRATNSGELAKAVDWHIPMSTKNGLEAIAPLITALKTEAIQKLQENTKCK